MATEEDSHLHPGSFYLLNDSAAPFPSRVKLSRALWVSSKFIVPNKDQALLNWICGQATANESNPCNFKLAMNTTIDFLNSKSLADQTESQDKTFQIKPNFIPTLNKQIGRNMTDADILKCAMEIGKSLIQNKGISSSLSYHYEILVEFVSTWIKVLLHHMKNLDENTSNKVENEKELMKFIIMLLKYCEKFRSEKCNRRRIVNGFCQNLLSLLLELHYNCNKGKIFKEEHLQKALTEGIESAISSAIFAKDCSDIYNELSNVKNEPADKENNKKIQKSKTLIFILKSLEASVRKDGITEKETGHQLMVFYKLFLTSYKHLSTDLKIRLLKELVQFACMHDTTCTNDISQCTKLNVTALHMLFKLALDFRLYQPAVDKIHSENLLSWLKEIATSLLDNYEVSPAWCLCLTVLAKIDRTTIETRLKTLLLKLSLSKINIDSMLSVQVTELIECLVDVYVKMRQPLRLVKLLLIVMTSSTEKGSLNVSGMTAMENFIVKFGEYIGGQFISKISPSVIIDIWSTLLDDIHKNVETLDSIKALSNDPFPGELSSISQYLHVLFKFFAKIASQSPILIMWEHLTVRPKLDNSLESLKSDVKTLFNSITMISSKDTCNVIHSNITETFLVGFLTYMRANDVLKRFAIVEGPNLTPGIASWLYKDELPPLDSLMQEEDDLEFQDIPWRCSNRAKLLFIELTLHRIYSIKVNLNALEMLQKSTEGKHKGLKKLRKVLEGKLSGFFEDLLEVIESMKGKNGNTPGLHTEAEMEFDVFKLFVNFLPVFQHHQSTEIAQWIADAVLSSVSNGKYMSSDTNAIIPKFFSEICSHSDSILMDILLEKMFENFTLVISPLAWSNAMNNVMVNDHSLKKDVKNLLKEEIMIECIKDLEYEELFDAIRGFADIFRLVELENLPYSQAKKAFHILICCIRITEAFLFTSIANDFKIVNIEALLEALLTSLMYLSSSNRTTLIRSYMPMEFIFPYMTRVKTLLSIECQNKLKIFLFDVAHATYESCSENAILNTADQNMANLKVITPPRELPSATATMTSLHILALVELFSSSEESMIRPSNEPVAGTKKRKMKPELYICKKLKLERNEEDETPTKVNLILQQMERLLRKGISILEDQPIVNDDIKYELLYACVKSLKLLSVDHNIVVRVKSYFLEAMTELEDKKDLSGQTATIKFIRSFIKSDNYSIDHKHLQHFLDLYRCMLPNKLGLDYLNDIIIHIIKKMNPLDIQTQVFNFIVGNLKNDNDRLEVTLKFAEILLSSGIFPGTDQGADQQQRKNMCSRFLKLTLDAVIALIKPTSKQRSTLPLVLKLLETILKLRWMRFQTSQLANIFSAIQGIPLVEMSNNVLRVEDVEYVFIIFESCCKIIYHTMLQLRETVRDVVPLCNAAFRQLLKSALHLGRQRDTSNIAVTEATKCARLLEKLFQSVVDNHKKAFTKCASYVVADYVCVISSFTVIPAVKKAVVNSVYHLVSLMDEYDTAMVRNSLPIGAGDVFQSMYLDYCKYFKYSGRI